MTLSREELIRRRASITKGMLLQFDCAVPTRFEPPSDLAAIRERLNLLHKKFEEAAALARRRS